MAETPVRMAPGAAPQVSAGRESVGARGSERSRPQRGGVGSAVRVWFRERLGGEVLESTRRLFFALALLSLAPSLLQPFGAPSVSLRLTGFACLVVLAASWSIGYSRRRVPVHLDVIDTVALLGFAVVSSESAAVLPLVFASVWFRSTYGTAARATLRASLYLGVVLLAGPLWSLVPGHAGGPQSILVSGAAPILLVTAVVGHRLAVIIRERAQAQHLDAAVIAVGTRLLGARDYLDIRALAWDAVRQVCAVTPGLRTVRVIADRGLLHVDGSTAGFGDLPATLPADVLAAILAGSGPSRGHPELDALAGVGCEWTCLRLPAAPNGLDPAWLVIGSTSSIPTDSLRALEGVSNQVTLALRNSAVRRDLTVQATLDSLTGLPNRATFNTTLSAALDDDPTRRVAILFVDLDDFKDVNDTFGHRVGDTLLREVASRLVRATRPQDLCARIGGDEFAIVLEDANAADALAVADRIAQMVAVPTHVSGRMVRLAVSIGIATATASTDPEMLIHSADVAMYAAKANGKARVQVYEPGLQHGHSAQADFEKALGGAAGNGELVLHYQPVVSPRDGRCTAVEALVRWQHPDKGLLYPDSFIETAERIGAICDIGTHVLWRAIADAAGWRDAHRSSPLAIHVNVSALQLDDDEFVDSVARCLREYAWPPEQLVLEFTETVMISSPAAIDRLNALADHGVLIAIDDFGTGYSSLTTLRALPVQIVKIDKSFVAGATVNREDRAVTEAIVMMANQMGVRTIAEGVERVDQQELLDGIGTDGLQGYLYLRPSPAKEFAEWLGARHRAYPSVPDSPRPSATPR